MCNYYDDAVPHDQIPILVCILPLKLRTFVFVMLDTVCIEYVSLLISYVSFQGGSVRTEWSTENVDHFARTLATVTLVPIHVSLCVVLLEAATVLTDTSWQMDAVLQQSWHVKVSMQECSK